MRTKGDILLNPEYKQLQGIYLQEPSAMSSEELSTFLEMNQADPSAPFREARIKMLEREIKARESLSDAERRWHEEWTAAALEYKALTEKWEVAGAKWRSLGSMVIWEYHGERFYHWFSGSMILENIGKARTADEIFKVLLSEKGGRNSETETVFSENQKR